MLRNLLMVLLACIALEAPLTLTPTQASAATHHADKKKYKVMYRKPKDKHYKKFGTFKTAGAALAAANRLRARGFQAKIR